MGDASFGLEIAEDSALIKVLTQVPKTDKMNSKMLLREAYETTQGVFDHLNQYVTESAITDPSLKRPLSSIGLHPNEDVCTGSRLYNVIRVFSDKKVYQHFGMSLIEFLSLPHDLVDLIVTESDKRLQREISSTNEVLSNLRNEK